jgi:hypothetical protein
MMNHTPRSMLMCGYCIDPNGKVGAVADCYGLKYRGEDRWMAFGEASQWVADQAVEHRIRTFDAMCAHILEQGFESAGGFSMERTLQAFFFMESDFIWAYRPEKEEVYGLISGRKPHVIVGSFFVDPAERPYQHFSVPAFTKYVMIKKANNPKMPDHPGALNSGVLMDHLGGLLRQKRFRMEDGSLDREFFNRVYKSPNTIANLRWGHPANTEETIGEALARLGIRIDQLHTVIA